MAGDWLKMETNTPDKEEVLSITALMGWDDPDLTVGKLFRLWRWFDQQTVDGNAQRVTTALLDRIVGVSGFCDAVCKVGWLEVSAHGVTLPKFDRHNGTTAKSRALTAKRVAKHKANSEGNDDANARSVSYALPREEKRREEEEKHIRAVKARPTATPTGFAEFWSAWPNTDRKTNKKKCSEKWERAGLELKAKEIVAHVEAMKCTQKWRDHFEPAPLTYLNGELWGDGVSIDESANDELRSIFARAV